MPLTLEEVKDTFHRLDIVQMIGMFGEEAVFTERLAEVYKPLRAAYAKAGATGPLPRDVLIPLYVSTGAFDAQVQREIVASGKNVVPDDELEADAEGLDETVSLNEPGKKMAAVAEAEQEKKANRETAGGVPAGPNDPAGWPEGQICWYVRGGRPTKARFLRISEKGKAVIEFNEGEKIIERGVAMASLEPMDDSPPAPSGEFTPSVSMQPDKA